MKKLLFIHPFLFALYAVLFLYTQNISEYPEPALLTPLFLSILFTLLIFSLCGIIFKRIDASAVVTSIVVIICLSYSRFLTIFEHSSFLFLSHNMLVLFGAVVVFVVSVYGVLRFKKHLHKINKVFLAMSLFLLAFPLYTFITFETKTGRILTLELPRLLNKAATQKQDDPDIYYFIFDRYAGPKALEEQYGYDHSKFYTFLRKKGFYVAEDSTTNYPKTFLSLASSLNMQYNDHLTEKTNGGGTSDQTIATPYIRNNKVVDFLKKRGYSYVHIGPEWTPTSVNQNADIQYVFKDGLYPNADEFTTGFLNTTIAAPIFKELFKDTTAVSQNPENNEHRKRIIFAFNAIQEVPQIPGPKFVFMHVLMPHDPFVFDKDCNPLAESVVKTKTHQENYIGQMECASQQIEIMIEHILKNSKTPPIIVLQSDEGPFPMNESIPPLQGWGSASDTSLREKFPILNAYYFPGDKNPKVYQSITPVNSYRVIFNEYFGTDYQLLPDRNYVFQDEKNYYKFTDVTERVN